MYIGETGRNPETRVTEHKYAIRSCNTYNAIFNHVSTTNHSTDWDFSKLIFKCSNSKKRKRIESVFSNTQILTFVSELDPVEVIGGQVNPGLLPKSGRGRP